MKRTMIKIALLIAGGLYGMLANAQLPIRGTTINATAGFQVNGTAPNNYALCGNGTTAIFQVSCGPTPFYQVVARAGIGLPQTSILDFSTNFSLGTTGSTEVDLAATISSNTSGRAAVATLADNATHAGSADNATNATHATNADNTTNATNLVATGMGFPARAFGTTYTASPVRREVMITANCNCNVGHNSQLTAYVNGNKVGANSTQNGGGLISVTFVVPPNGTYSATFSEVGTSGGTLSLDTWTEWDN